MYVCMHMCMYVCIQTIDLTHDESLREEGLRHADVEVLSVLFCEAEQVCVCMHVCMYVCMFEACGGVACAGLCEAEQVCVRMHVCMYVCMFEACGCRGALFIHTHIHTYMYTSEMGSKRPKRT